VEMVLAAGAFLTIDEISHFVESCLSLGGYGTQLRS
jgi:hypothetical protein